MLSFLKVVAAAFVALLVLIALIVLLIRWKFRSFMRTLKDSVARASASGIPPFRITLVPMDEDADDVSDDTEWHHEDQVRHLTTEMDNAGFTFIGDYYETTLPLKFRAFQHHDHQAWGVIYDHLVAGCWCDVVRRYRNDTMWTCSTGRQHGMDPTPFGTTEFFPGESVQTILNRLVEVSPSEGLLPAGADSFVKSFEAAYAREMNWRIERGGPTEEEIQRIAALSQQECSPENVAAIQRQWRLRIGEFLTEKMIRAWRKESGTSSTAFERMSDRVVAIHKRLLPEQLLQALEPDFDAMSYTGTDEEDDLPEGWSEDLVQLKQDAQRESPVVAFRNLLTSRGVMSRWTRLAEMQKPLRGEIWLRPEGDENEDDEDDDSEYDEDFN